MNTDLACFLTLALPVLFILLSVTRWEEGR